MQRWLICAILLVLVAAAACADGPGAIRPPVDQWSRGDWWEAQLEHQALHFGTDMTGWLPSYRLHFAVTHTDEREVRVEVTTIPDNRLRQRLILSYAPDGKLVSAQVVEPNREEPLGSAGSLGTFGMLGREAFDVAKAPETRLSDLPPGPAEAPVAKPEGDRTVRIAVDKEGRSFQTWEPGAPFWKQFETSDATGVRATLLAGVWRRRAASAPAADQ